MIVFKDVVTGEDLFSDAYRYEIVDDLYYLVHGKYVTRKDNADYNIGSNPSQEEEEEGVEEASTSGIDICLDNNLEELKDMTTFPQFRDAYKSYTKKTKAKVLEYDSNFDFKKCSDGVKKFFKIVESKVDDCQFFTPVSFEGVTIPCYGEDDKGEKYALMFFKDLIRQEKM